MREMAPRIRFTNPRGTVPKPKITPVSCACAAHQLATELASTVNDARHDRSNNFEVEYSASQNPQATATSCYSVSKEPSYKIQRKVWHLPSESYTTNRATKGLLSSRLTFIEVFLRFRVRVSHARCDALFSRV
jgi:hypothetical protein